MRNLFRILGCLIIFVPCVALAQMPNPALYSPGAGGGGGGTGMALDASNATNPTAGQNLVAGLNLSGLLKMNGSSNPSAAQNGTDFTLVTTTDCTGTGHLLSLTASGIGNCSPDAGVTAVYTGTTAGSANTYTIATPFPTTPLYTLTDQFTVVATISATNTGDSTLNVRSTGAKHIKTNTSTGLALLAGGELISGGNNEYLFVYNLTCDCYVLMNTPAAPIVAGTTQAVHAPAWTALTMYDVTTASQTLTLDVSTGLSPNGGIFVKADTQSATVTATSPDTINGGSAGGSVTIPVGVLAAITTDGAGHVYANTGQTIPLAATTTVAGIVKLYNAPMSAGWLSGTNPDQGIIVSAVPQALTVTAINANATALAGGTATIDVYDIASGTATCQNGTKVTTSSFNANTSAGTPQALFSGTYSLAANHSLCIRATTWPGSPTSTATISVYGAPS